MVFLCDFRSTSPYSLPPPQTTVTQHRSLAECSAAYHVYGSSRRIVRQTCPSCESTVGSAGSSAGRTEVAPPYGAMAASAEIALRCGKGCNHVREYFDRQHFREYSSASTLAAAPGRFLPPSLQPIRGIAPMSRGGGGGLSDQGFTNRGAMSERGGNKERGIETDFSERGAVSERETSDRVLNRISDQHQRDSNKSFSRRREWTGGISDLRSERFEESAFRRNAGKMISGNLERHRDLDFVTSSSSRRKEGGREKGQGLYNKEGEREEATPPHRLPILFHHQPPDQSTLGCRNLVRPTPIVPAPYLQIHSGLPFSPAFVSAAAAAGMSYYIDLGLYLDG